MLGSFRVSAVPALRAVGTAYVTVFRNTPLLVVFVLIYYGLPELEIRPSVFWRSTLALSLYTSAFVCEAVRSGVNAVAAGQAEAARSIGMGFGQTLRIVVLPQAFRAVIPPLANVLIALAKNTSLVAAFGVADLTFRMRGLINDNPGDVYADLRRDRAVLRAHRGRHLADRPRAGAQCGGRPMSSVLFDIPGPGGAAPSAHRQRGHVVVLVVLAALALWKLQAEGQLSAEAWEVFVTPAYMQALLEASAGHVASSRRWPSCSRSSSARCSRSGGCPSGSGSAGRPRWSSSSSAPSRCSCSSSRSTWSTATCSGSSGRW